INVDIFVDVGELKRKKACVHRQKQARYSIDGLRLGRWTNFSRSSELFLFPLNVTTESKRKSAPTVTARQGSRLCRCLWLLHGKVRLSPNLNIPKRDCCDSNIGI